MRNSSIKIWGKLFCLGSAAGVRLTAIRTEMYLVCFYCWLSCFSQYTLQQDLNAGFPSVFIVKQYHDVNYGNLVHPAQGLETDRGGNSENKLLLDFHL